MKCDELKAYKGDVTIPVYGTIADTEVYLKKDADATIAELKEKLHDIDNQWNEQCKDIEEMRGQHQMLKQFGHYKLSPVTGKMINHELRQYVSYNVVCMIITHLESENAELKQKLENVQASMYADVVDANMENRKLKRALWLARALRARDIQRWWIAATCAPITERACSVWNNVERKCREKAEEYK